MNADPSKEIVAQAQSYFAISTRRAELADAETFATLPEDGKRLSLRAERHYQDKALTVAAGAAGVATPDQQEEFQEAGYKGLYGELDRSSIKAKKGIPAQADLLDHIGGRELAANLFRATQTEQRLEREQPADPEQAGAIHHETGQKVREFISEMGNTMPEELPAAAPPIPELEEQERKALRAKRLPKKVKLLRSRK